MNKMKCRIQSHNEKEIHIICLDKNCKTKRLCCLSCITTFHNAHADKLVDFDGVNLFLQQVNSKYVSNDQTQNFGQKQMIQGLERLLALFDKLQQILLEKLVKFCKVIKEKIEKIKQQNLQEYLKQTGESQAQKGIEYWNQFLEGILQYVEIDNCLLKLPTYKEGQLNQIEEKEIKIIKHTEEILQNLIHYINPPQMKIGELCFKKNRTNPDIAIIDESTLKKIKSSHAMAYANEGFDPKNQSYRFAFNILNLDNDLSERFGVGNDEVQNAYELSFSSQLGSGQYLIGNTGKTYHHSDEALNYKEKGIKFITGDRIQIKYNHVTKVQTKQTYKYYKEDCRKNDHYRYDQEIVSMCFSLLKGRHSLIS